MSLAVAVERPVAALAAYLAQPLVKSIRFSEESGCYTYREPSLTAPVHVGGVINHIRRVHYPRYVASKGKRKRTLVRGSTAKQGKTVDAQLAASIVGKRPKHRMALAVLDHFALRGQTLQACQVPCWVRQFRAITQADCITSDAKGALHLYEIKSGFPVGGFRKQGTMTGHGALATVPSTKMNHWQLQLRYTQLGFTGSVEFASASVIQVYDKKGTEGVQIKIHPQPEWARKIK